VCGQCARFSAGCVLWPGSSPIDLHRLSYLARPHFHGRRRRGQISQKMILVLNLLLAAPMAEPIIYGTLAAHFTGEVFLASASTPRIRRTASSPCFPCIVWLSAPMCGPAFSARCRSPACARSACRTRQNNNTHPACGYRTHALVHLQPIPRPRALVSRTQRPQRINPHSTRGKSSNSRYVDRPQLFSAFSVAKLITSNRIHLSVKSVVVLSR
jgi:hypothetical protein